MHVIWPTWNVQIQACPFRHIGMQWPNASHSFINFEHWDVKTRAIYVCLCWTWITDVVLTCFIQDTHLSFIRHLAWRLTRFSPKYIIVRHMLKWNDLLYLYQSPCWFELMSFWFVILTQRHILIIRQIYSVCKMFSCVRWYLTTWLYHIVIWLFFSNCKMT